MKAKIKNTLLLVFLFYVSSYSQNNGIINEIIQQTNLDSLTKYVRILSGEDSVFISGQKRIIFSRADGEEGNSLTALYLKQKLENYGLEVDFQDFGTAGGRNVIAVKEGTVYPDEQYIICAHYDAVTYFCADDNASGSAAVIEAARILSGFESKYTIIFAFWDLEEIGLIGSHFYASRASNNEDNIKGVINIDMIGYDSNDDGLVEIHTRNNSLNISNAVVNVNNDYSIGLNTEVKLPGSTASDHASFWQYNFPAILLIEGYWSGDFNPFYHSTFDRINKFNLNYFHKYSKLAIATLSLLSEVESAVPVEEEKLIGLDYSLSQNYPNPFNGQTVINYSIKDPAFVNLTVYNVIGEEVANIVNEFKGKGNYKINFAANNLTSGIYFYKLTANYSSGNFTQIKKLILMK